MERFYYTFFQALPIKSVTTDDDLHLLSPEELHLVRKTERLALSGAVLIELVAYLFIFLPVYQFPHFFESHTVSLGGPFVHVTGKLHWAKDGWMFLVTVVELYVLLLLNLAAVHGVAVATGYIKRNQTAQETSGLIRIALDSRFSELQHFGIDPYERMNPWILYLFLVFNRLKGMIGSVIARAVLSNLFGREIMRVYLDFSGMPIYMAINMYTTHVILRNARVVVMGQTSIEIVLRQLPTLRLSPWELGLVYDSLQFIAVNKRDFHANHYYLTKAIVDHFGIEVEATHPLPADFLEKLKAARHPVTDICRLIIVLGFLLDGTLSWRERRQLTNLQQQGILELSHAELKNYLHQFVDGQGLDVVTSRLLGQAELFNNQSWVNDDE
jgi:hypothetical protein